MAQRKYSVREWLVTISALLLSSTLWAASSSSDATYAAGWGPALSARLPILQAPDQLGAEQSLSSLAGEKGLLLFIVRSADWCPFCKRQLLQLNEQASAFEALGLKVAAMSYDSPEILAGFHSSYSLSYPLLRDVERKHFSAYGVLNESYKPGHRAYGIPHPGVILIAPDGIVEAKFAVPGFRQRPPFDAMLEKLRAMMMSQAESGSGGPNKSS